MDQSAREQLPEKEVCAICNVPWLQKRGRWVWCWCWLRLNSPVNLSVPQFILLWLFACFPDFPHWRSFWDDPVQLTRCQNLIWLLTNWESPCWFVSTSLWKSRFSLCQSGTVYAHNNSFHVNYSQWPRVQHHIIFTPPFENYSACV